MKKPRSWRSLQEAGMAAVPFSRRAIPSRGRPAPTGRGSERKVAPYR